MGLQLTLGAMAAAALFGGFCAWRGARPPDITRGPRMIPWRWMMLLAAVAELTLLVHLLALLSGNEGV